MWCMSTYAADITFTTEHERAIDRDGRPVPRWANRAAHLVPLVTLPAALWRLPIVFGFSLGTRTSGAEVHVRGWESVYILALSIVTEVARAPDARAGPALGRARARAGSRSSAAGACGRWPSSCPPRSGRCC